MPRLRRSLRCWLLQPGRQRVLPGDLARRRMRQWKRPALRCRHGGRAARHAAQGGRS
jgi:hypothetical protein